LGTTGVDRIAISHDVAISKTFGEQFLTSIAQIE